MGITDLGRRDSVSLEQDTNEYCVKIKQKLQTPGHAPGNFFVADGLLWYADKTTPVQRLVLPKSLVPLVCEAFHSSLLGGHFSVLRTVKKIQRRFFWKGLRKDMESFVRSCESCQQNQIRNVNPLGLMQNLIIPDAPWAMWRWTLSVH